LSIIHRISDAGPSVIGRYNSDGGYFVVFRNDSSVRIADACALQRTGSP